MHTKSTREWHKAKGKDTQHGAISTFKHDAALCSSMRVAACNMEHRYETLGGAYPTSSEVSR